MIYADNAATTKISEIAFAKMLPFLQEQFGNASSQYSFGVKARRAVEDARQQVANAIGAESNEIIFTSGGSETNSWVLHHIAEAYRGENIHIITSSIEHPSVLNTCHALEKERVDVTYLPVDKTGRVLIDTVSAAIKPNTKLVSIMLANNEIGTIQPISEIGLLLKSKGVLFHTDAVQAIGHILVDINDLKVDFLTASAHKFNGAKGTGFLYKRKNINLPPMIFGGEQERGYRAGTENVAGIVSAGYALEENAKEMVENTKLLNSLTEATINGIQSKIPFVRINGNALNCLPGIINLCFESVSGESLMHLLDLKGICISTSSACASGKNEPSHVLTALGLSEKQAKSAIRISYGKYNTSDEVNIIVSAVSEAYNKIKTIS